MSNLAPTAPIPQVRKLKLGAMPAPDVDKIDKTIETYSERKDTPYMTKPSEQRAASETAAPAPAAAPLAKDNVTTIKHRPKKTAAETKRVSHDFPLYLIKELRMAAAQSGKTQKFLILNALKAGGFTVHDADLEEDGRRGQ
ncbi:conserved hypothetical protein [Hyphomicrobium sp. GJ21]|uniref:hypothetical protein n=1 Tax=Hyphomicrobium sp. GJ21 TaxID=113574 RepID=UPI000622BEF7|nr:hypothetical protein [Hyphomicrobium sp. GJ21]CEJ87869.1 conserved hypothetical protein [Hyphomicrobium sp. GJ21]